MSVFDIVWIAVIILWILRSVSRASGGAAEGRSPETLPSDVEEEKTSGPDWRGRLLEAAREWEAEQQRQAGKPVEAPAAEPPPERPRSSVLVRDVTPDRVESGLAASAGSVSATDATTRRSAEAVPEVVATPIEARSRGPKTLPAALVALERYSPLRRAVLYREIFGPPRGLGETDEPHGI